MDVINSIIASVVLVLFLSIFIGKICGVDAQRVISTYLNLIVQVLVVIGEVLIKLAIPLVKQLGETIVYVGNHLLEDTKGQGPAAMQPPPASSPSSPQSQSSKAQPGPATKPEPTTEPEQDGSGAAATEKAVEPHQQEAAERVGLPPSWFEYEPLPEAEQAEAEAESGMMVNAHSEQDRECEEKTPGNEQSTQRESAIGASQPAEPPAPQMKEPPVKDSLINESQASKVSEQAIEKSIEKANAAIKPEVSAGQDQEETKVAERQKVSSANPFDDPPMPEIME